MSEHSAALASEDMAGNRIFSYEAGGRIGLPKLNTNGTVNEGVPSNLLFEEILAKRRALPPLLDSKTLEEVHKRIEDSDPLDLQQIVDGFIQKRSMFNDGRAEFYMLFYIVAGALRLVQFEGKE